MNPSVTKVVLLFASSLLICSSFFAAGVFAEASLLDQICRLDEGTRYKYEDCVSALSVDPKSKTTNDLTELGKIAMRIAIANVTSIQNYIKKKAEAGGSEGYKSCLDVYDKAISSLKTALGELDEEPFQAGSDVSLLMDDSDECESKMKAAKTTDAVVAAGNGYMKLFGAIGEAITDET